MRVLLDITLAGPIYVHLNTVSPHFGAETNMMDVFEMLLKRYINTCRNLYVKQKGSMYISKEVNLSKSQELNLNNSS